MELVFSGPNPYKRRDILLLLDFADGVAYIAEITDLAECRTPDGLHFAACKVLKKFRRRKMTESFWSEMKELGVVTSKLSGNNPRKLLGKSLRESIETAFQTR